MSLLSVLGMFAIQHYNLLYDKSFKTYLKQYSFPLSLQCSVILCGLENTVAQEFSSDCSQGVTTVSSVAFIPLVGEGLEPEEMR